MNSLAYHIYRVFCANDDQLKKLWRVISKFLWSKGKYDGTISHHFKVSQKRIGSDYQHGGLKAPKFFYLVYIFH